jgi:predicted transcriptional regulator
MQKGLLEGKLESAVYMIKKFGADINEIAKELNISKNKILKYLNENKD